MIRRSLWITLLVIISIELFAFIAAFSYPFIGLYSLIVGLIIIIAIWIFGCHKKKPSKSEVKEFLKERDATRLLIGVIFMMAAVDLFAIYSLVKMQYDPTSLTIYLGLYLTGLPILIDGMWPKK